ncbi:TetR/AcrR family transcriptional regulator [Sporomusa sphaeroides]|uniref:Bacterial regulatory proteins, tetR family n=1 Tax=Sporomusa sphaeroides DSM 2875 TaxID=1337886 RepID=A0ABM9W2M5_9FIRM|nr:TetR/AcrR family transcriptional regulator [Sporomusa sphaeroides]OLS55650.1 bacterial regulatory protein, tetR family [Sporomusa sphaeroides DSM 2875]CVK19424.1 Bacterial regulatory proteins, tetR family [Sporomusa sphaeroides DSM 2875]
MRNRIIMATVEEINLRGFKFTMSDLTKRLSISKSSLYEHFSSKDELIATIVAIVLNDFRKQEEKIYTSHLPITEKLKAALTITPETFEPFHNRVYDDLRLTYPNEWKKVTLFRQERMDRLANLLSENMKAGTIRHVHLGVLQQMIISTINDLISYRFLADHNMTYPDAVTAMLDVMIHGIMVKE